jgi:uncharacterized protein
MITKKDIEKIEKIAREYFIGASGCHDWSHIERVRNLSLRIGKIEKADLKIVEVAVLLHDIGRKCEMENKGERAGEKICHAVESKNESKKILANFKNISLEEKENILHSIEAHRHRNTLKPETLEARVVFDADKLDSIGAVGIARDFLFAGGAGSNCLYTGNEKRLAKKGKDLSYTEEDSAILEYEVKLKHIKNKMLTKTGKLMAKERDKFMRDFFKTFWLEVAGKK